VCEVVSRVFPDSYDEHEWDKIAERAIKLKNYMSAFHFLQHANVRWSDTKKVKETIEKIADITSKKGSEIYAFDMYLHLGVEDNIDRCYELALKILKKQEPSKKLKKEEKNKIVLNLSHKSDIFCISNAINSWEWFYMYNYENEEIDERLKINEFEQDYKN
jgi:hypothetical protein